MKVNDSISLVVTDLDGTFLNDKSEISPRALAAAQALPAQGVHFTICSARPTWAVVSIAEQSGVTLPFGALNGSVILNSQLQVLKQHLLGPRRTRKSIEFFRSRGVNVLLMTATDWYVLDRNGDFVEEEVRVCKREPHVVESFEPYLSQTVTIVGVSKDAERISSLQRELATRYGKGASVVRSNPNYVNVTNAKANKGSFVRWVSRTLRVPKAQIACLGDMPSDARMFPWCRLGIAMGNAPEEVKSQATYVAGHHAEDGWAKAIEELVLNKVA